MGVVRPNRRSARAAAHGRCGGEAAPGTASANAAAPADPVSPRASPPGAQTESTATLERRPPRNLGDEPSRPAHAHRPLRRTEAAARLVRALPAELPGRRARLRERSRADEEDLPGALRVRAGTGRRAFPVRRRFGRGGQGVPAREGIRLRRPRLRDRAGVRSARRAGAAQPDGGRARLALRHAGLGRRGNAGRHQGRDGREGVGQGRVGPARPELRRRRGQLLPHGARAACGLDGEDPHVRDAAPRGQAVARDRRRDLGPADLRGLGLRRPEGHPDPRELRPRPRAHRRPGWYGVLARPTVADAPDTPSSATGASRSSS